VLRSAKSSRPGAAILLWIAGGFVFCFLFLLGMDYPQAVAASTPFPDEAPSETIGSIEGDAISVQGPMTVQVVNGLVKTILRSGSDIRVKSGRAQINLVEGGRIVICGPAHLTILKSGRALTVALESGTVHSFITHGPALTVYTAQIQAQPLAIGDGAQDSLVGFDTPGAMCVRAKNGAIRLEQQLTGQSLVVPQGGDVTVTNGQLDGVRAGTGHCSCDLEIATIAPPHMESESALIASAKDAKPNPPAVKNGKPTPAPDVASDQPIYHVFMPPLRYDASAKIQDVPDPRLIVLVRQVRVRPTLIFEAQVEGDPVVAENTSPQIPAAQPANAGQSRSSKSATPQANNSVMDRVKSFFRRLWNRSS
jgi:hypothetical protein